jgi:hypothetical protein
VWGVDVAETALAIALEKAAQRSIEGKFAIADALHLELLGRAFETVLDCALFHTFGSGERSASVSPDRLRTRFAPQGAAAWLAKVERT